MIFLTEMESRELNTLGVFIKLHEGVIISFESCIKMSEKVNSFCEIVKIVKFTSMY